MKDLTPKQRKALEIITDTIHQKGYPPTLADLSQALGASSRNTAVKYLTILAREGYIIWERNKARGIQLVPKATVPDHEGGVMLPLVGSVTAGLPMLAEENIERYVSVPPHLVSTFHTHFLVKVQGDSMVDAGIFDGDLVIVRSQPSADQGAIVVALIEGEATVKRLAVRKGVRYLKPENSEYSDIFPHTQWSVQGRVVSLLRENVE